MRTDCSDVMVLVMFLPLCRVTSSGQTWKNSLHNLTTSCANVSSEVLITDFIFTGFNATFSLPNTQRDTCCHSSETHTGRC